MYGLSRVELLGIANDKMKPLSNRWQNVMPESEERRPLTLKTAWQPAIPSVRGSGSGRLLWWLMDFLSLVLSWWWLSGCWLSFCPFGWNFDHIHFILLNLLFLRLRRFKETADYDEPKQSSELWSPASAVALTSAWSQGRNSRLKLMYVAARPDGFTRNSKVASPGIWVSLSNPICWHRQEMNQEKNKKGWKM